MTLNGTLEDFSPAGILKVLSTDGRTGAVRFGGPHGCTVYLHRGQLYFARSESTDQALATALVRPGRLSADGWGKAIDVAGDRPMVGELLVRDGAISSDLLASVVLSVIYDPLIDLFRDGTGEFDFETDTVHWLGPFRAFPVDAIVGEVRKRVREVDEWSNEIPGLDAWVEASRTLPGNAAQVTILREDWELVTALAGPRTIRELAIELGRGAYSTARVVNRLHQAGLVEVVYTDAEAKVVPIRRPDPLDDPPAPELEVEADPLLAMGLPHRTTRTERAQGPAPDPLAAHIGDAIADALAERGDATTDDGPGETDSTIGGFGDLKEVDHPTPDPFGDAPEASDSPFRDAPTLVGDDPFRDAPADSFGEAPANPLDDSSADFGSDDGPAGSTTALADRPDLDAIMDFATNGPFVSATDLVGGAPPDHDPEAELHHDDAEGTPVDQERPADPNAAWLADLYAQFIDEPEAAAAGANGTAKKRRRGEPNPVDVAFRSDEQDAETKVSTLKRLMGALRKL